MQSNKLNQFNLMSNCWDFWIIYVQCVFKRSVSESKEKSPPLEHSLFLFYYRWTKFFHLSLTHVNLSCCLSWFFCHITCFKSVFALMIVSTFWYWYGALLDWILTDLMVCFVWFRCEWRHEYTMTNLLQHNCFKNARTILYLAVFMRSGSHSFLCMLHLIIPAPSIYFIL